MSTHEKIVEYPSLSSIPEAEFPRELHGKIMKRVFFAGYGKYLYLSTGVLFLNLSVLGRELWKTVKSLSFEPGSLSGFEFIPLHVTLTLAITAAATAYAFHMIWKLHKAYRVFVFAR